MIRQLRITKLCKSRKAACAYLTITNDSSLTRQIPNNFFATPHIGGSAEEARLAMGRIAIDGITDNAVPEPGVPPFV